MWCFSHDAQQALAKDVDGDAVDPCWASPQSVGNLPQLAVPLAHEERQGWAEPCRFAAPAEQPTCKFNVHTEKTTPPSPPPRRTAPARASGVRMRPALVDEHEVRVLFTPPHERRGFSSGSCKVVRKLGPICPSQPRPATAATARRAFQGQRPIITRGEVQHPFARSFSSRLVSPPGCGGGQLSPQPPTEEKLLRPFDFNFGDSSSSSESEEEASVLQPGMRVTVFGAPGPFFAGKENGLAGIAEADAGEGRWKIRFADGIGVMVGTDRVYIPCGGCHANAENVLLLIPGARVGIAGLTEFPHLNGQLGTAEADLQDGRWKVRLADWSWHLVCVDNLNILASSQIPRALARDLAFAAKDREAAHSQALVWERLYALQVAEEVDLQRARSLVLEQLPVNEVAGAAPVADAEKLLTSQSCVAFGASVGRASPVPLSLPLSTLTSSVQIDAYIDSTPSSTVSLSVKSDATCQHSGRICPTSAGLHRSPRCSATKRESPNDKRLILRSRKLTFGDNECPDVRDDVRDDVINEAMPIHCFSGSARSGLRPSALSEPCGDDADDFPSEIDEDGWPLLASEGNSQAREQMRKDDFLSVGSCAQRISMGGG